MDGAVVAGAERAGVAQRNILAEHARPEPAVTTGRAITAGARFALNLPELVNADHYGRSGYLCALYARGALCTNRRSLHSATAFLVFQSTTTGAGVISA